MKLFNFFAILLFNFNLISENNFQQVKKSRGRFLSWEDEEFSNKDTFHQYLKRCLDYQNSPQKVKVHNAAFNIIGSSESSFKTNKILEDLVTWQDLNLFTGKDVHEGSLVDLAIPTQTEIGKAWASVCLANPTDNISEIHVVQAVVKELVENEQLFNSLEVALEEFHENENKLLSFYVNDSLGTSFSNQGAYLKLPFFKKVAAKLNKSSSFLEFMNFHSYESKVSNLTLDSVSTVVLPVYAVSLLYKNKLPEAMSKFAQDLKRGSSQAALFSLACNKIATYPKYKEFIKEYETGINAGGCVSNSVLYAFGVKSYKDWMQATLFLEKCMREKLSGVAGCLKSMEVVNNQVKTSKIDGLKQFKELHMLLEAEPEKDVERLLDVLRGKTFNKGDVWFFRRGPVLNAAALIREHKDKLSPALSAVAELDVYLAVARQIKSGAFCFAEVLSIDKPQVDLVSFWNPLLDKGKAISNSLYLNKNAILTGPNAGGKSTVLKAVALNLILAQTFGVAAAKQMRFTPFSKIATYLNIVDDIGQGNSLFKSEVLRTQSLIKSIESLNENQFSFLAIDEMFSGTSPDEGSAAAYGVAKYLGKIDNSICMVASHFKDLTALEDKSNYVNYKVSVDFDEEGNVKFPFKLSSGISHQHIAFKILEAEGFDLQILDDAHNMLKRKIA